MNEECPSYSSIGPLNDFGAEEEAMVTTKQRFTKDTVIGEAVKYSPAASKVIEKYFGNGCFTCPGINMESISFGAMMHNMDPEKIVKELNELEGEDGG
jgi:hybrid cluster-associated redox disulfide protein